jgi:hypothetical protein
MSEALRLEYDTATQTLYLHLPADTPAPTTGHARRRCGAAQETRIHLVVCVPAGVAAFIEHMQPPGFVPVPPDDDSGACAYLPVYRYEETP